MGLACSTTITARTRAAIYKSKPRAAVHSSLKGCAWVSGGDAGDGDADEHEDPHCRPPQNPNPLSPDFVHCCPARM